ncbi:quinolinate synthase NadA [bacterium]|nr:quinolinate synthase NadA [bacterium]
MNKLALMRDSLDEATQADLISRIREHKERWGEKLVILGHHYQRKEIVYLSDFIGDSFKLCKQAAEQEKADYIVFCGVHFMAESAKILAQPHQRVFHPNLHAGCPMADMAPLNRVTEAWAEMGKILGDMNEKVMPITYMNSDGQIKAFTGMNGGTVCTSSNAPKAFEWALDRREKVFFFPDEFLGRNTAQKMGFADDEVVVWKWRAKEPLGGNTPEAIQKAKVIVWKGFCHVHTHFADTMIDDVRKKQPNAKVVVHPECPLETTAKTDAMGSTEFICQFVDEAAAGSTIAIGTELNMVERLQEEYPDRNIIPISPSLCHNMIKINLENLCETLDKLGEHNEITVPPQIAQYAKQALDRMLTIQ